MGLLPLLIKLGRTKYANWSQDKSSVHPSMEGHSEGSRLLNSRDRTYGSADSRKRSKHTGADGEMDSQASSDSGDEAKDKGAARFDLYFGAVSFCIDAIALTGVGLSSQVWQLYACKHRPLKPAGSANYARVLATALLSISAAGGPSLQSIITQISPKAMTDECADSLRLAIG